MENQCIRQSAIPHATRLFTDFLYQFECVRPFYSFEPFDDQSFFRAARALTYPEATRASVTAVLEEQSALFGATDQTRRNIERLRRGAVAVVTGQQVGLFTGPMFAFYKALTAIRLADLLSERGLECVPVFWLATEDHDLEEVNHAFLLEAGYRSHRIADGPAPHVHGAPVGEVKLGPNVSRHSQQAAALLPPTEWTAELAAMLHDTYRPGETYGQSFARLMNRLLGRFGVVMLDPMHLQLRRLAAGLFRRALESADELGAMLLERNRELVKAGYHAQVHVTENSTLLFRRWEGQRIALDRKSTRLNSSHSRASRMPSSA